MGIKKLIGAVLLFLLLWAWAGTAETASQPESGAIQIQNHPFGSEITLKGVLSTGRTYFPGGPYREVRQANATLVFTQSELLQPEGSTLTVLLNGIPIYSVSLAGKFKNRESLNFPLPPARLTEGVNELRLDVSRRISSNPCTDAVDPANWISFHSDSYVHLEFIERKPAPLLSRFPYPFLKSGGKSRAGCLLMLSDDFGNEELQAALLLSSHLGAKDKERSTEITLARYSEAKSKEKEDIIYIGTPDNTPQEIRLLLQNTELEKAKEGAVLKIAVSPYNKEKEILCIFSSTGGSLFENAANLLRSDVLVHQLQKDSFVMDTALETAMPPKPYMDNRTLGDLGFPGGILLKGSSHQQASIGIKLPKNRTLQVGAKADFTIRYAKNLDFTRSLASVFINGIPVGSKVLDPNAANEDHLEVTFPREALKGSYFDVSVSFDLELPEGDCVLPAQEVPWAYIAEGSSFYLPTGSENAFLLENYPNPFVADGEWNNPALVLPDRPAAQDLNMAANITAFIGRELQSNRGKLHVLYSSQFTQDYHDKNLIVLGTPENNLLIRQVNGSLWFPYTPNFSAFQSNERKRLLESYASSLSTIQLIPSPFQRDCHMMVVTAPVKEHLYKSSRYLSDPQLFSKLYGDCVLLDDAGNAQYFYFKGPEKSARPFLSDAVLSGNHMNVFLVFFGAVLLFSVAGLVFYVRKYGKW